MPPRITELLDRIKALEDELAQELERGLILRGFSLKDRLGTFERDVIDRHRTLRLGLVRFLRRSRLASVASAPVIYSLILPLLALDISVSLYQTICFRLYRIPQVRRSEYLHFDRHHLAYLNWIEGLNCTYCAYANGIIAYAREIAGRTEQYWCPIKHARRIRDPHHHALDFVDYGDADGYRARLPDLRRRVQTAHAPAPDRPSRDHELEPRAVKPTRPDSTD